MLRRSRAALASALISTLLSLGCADDPDTEAPFGDDGDEADDDVVEGDCDDEDCDSEEPAEAYAPCNSESGCVEGNLCLPTRQERLADEPLCSPVYKEDTDCFTGCCGRLDTGEKVCGFPADCAPVDVGYPCLDSGDCASGDCRWGSCIEACESDDDCGTNQLGLPNHCHRETSDNGDVLSACLPGCNDERDCDFFYEEPFYVYHTEWAAVPLACVGEDGARYCF